jgi:hypothetical protein
MIIGKRKGFLVLHMMGAAFLFFLKHKSNLHALKACFSLRTALDTCLETSKLYEDQLLPMR